MLSKKVCTALLIVALPLLLSAGNNLTVSFHTGFPLNGMDVGYQMGAFVPYGGFDIVRVSSSATENYESWDRDYYSDVFYKDYEKHTEYSGSATLFVPNFGFRFYLSQQKIKSYVKGNFLLVIPSVSGTDKGTRTYYNPDGSIDYIDDWDDDLSDKEVDILEDALDLWGITMGFGLEYPFNEHFTIGGEFGLRIFGNSVTDKDSDSDEYDGKLQWKEDWNDELKATLGITYTAFSLNFYF